MDEIKTNVVRDGNGRFLPGQSGNPAGKKPGTRSHATLLREALNEGEDRAAARIVIDKALEGNLVAARFVVDRLMPRPRDRAIELDLPDGAGAGDIVAAYDVTVQAMMDGEITPEEALTVTRVLDGRLRARKAWQKENRVSHPARPEPSPACGRGPFQEPSPVSGRGGFHRESGRGRFPRDLLHSTCISTLPALASGGVRGAVPPRLIAGGAAFS